MKALAACLLLTVGTAHAWPGRSIQATAEFRRTHPCPSTGAKRGACPGYVIDHIEPLCAGGHDQHSNMQWQTIEAAKAKDRMERLQCRKLKASSALPGG